MDFGSTQDFEVTLYKKEDRSDEGQNLFSKAGIGFFPKDGWKGLRHKLSKIMSENK